MGSHRPPAPTRPSRLWLGLMGAAVTGIVAGTVAAGHASAPKVAADERLALTPERTPEPVARGPLVLPSIGASGAWQPPEDSVRDETPHHAAPSARHQPVAVRPPTVTTAAGMGTPATTTTPEVTTSTPTPPVAAATSTQTDGRSDATIPPPTALSSTAPSTPTADATSATSSPSASDTLQQPATTTASSGSTALDEEPVITP